MYPEEILKELEGLDVELTPEEFLRNVEIEGLDEATLEAIKPIIPAVAMVTRRKMLSQARQVVQKIQLPKERGIWFHGKLISSAASTDFFSSKSSSDRFNFKVDGIQPEKDVQIIGISAFFEPLAIPYTDYTSIISNMIKADVSLKVGDEEKLKVPLSYILDHDPAPMFDGNTSATNILFLRNSKLEKGVFKVDNIIFPAKKTLQVTVDFKASFTNNTYWLFFAVEYLK
jgi:hypothetical protein